MKQALVSGYILQNTPLPQFLEMFYKRCSRPEDSVIELTFRPNWSPITSVVINKTDGDNAWEELKEEVLDSYLIAKAEMSERRRFRVVVRDMSG